MNHRSNIGTIIRKEFARFFGDRSLVFTAVIMPGLLIYLIYTLMGSFMGDKAQEEIAKQEEMMAEFVSPLSEQESFLRDSLNTVYYEAEAAFRAAQNEDNEFQELGDVLGNLIPMLIIMLLFSGCMAVAPTSIAGEKERGTIATLLVTPLKRYELAAGKIISLSCFALLSGLSSFIGIILSLPKMLQGDDISLPDNIYASSDYLVILLVIVSTVLFIISAISILSALAKDVKSATTMVLPLMLFIMLSSLTPMMGTAHNPALFLIPVYNSAQCMASVFSFNLQQLPLLITLVSNCCYAALAVWILTKMFNNEKVMFGK